MPNQNGAPVPQDVHPNAYQAAAVNGPPGPQWGAAAPSQAHHTQGPPPQLNPGRQEWQRLADMHGGQTQPPPRPMNLYEQRDVGRGQPPPHQPSPRPEHSRHRDSLHGAPMHRPLTPSPRARKAVPYRAPQSMPPAPPPQTLPPHQQQPPNRITNPNFGGHTLPPTGITTQPASLGQGPLLPYARMGSPPPEARSIMMDGQPLSPRSQAHNAHHHHQAGVPYQHYGEPTATNNIASGLSAPSSALAAADAAARTRDRTPASAIPKRHREWEDHFDNGNAHKRNANEESRARVEDPHLMRRGTPSVPVTPIERDSWGVMGGPGPVQGGGTSPDAVRRGEEQRRANPSYRPNEAAHHPVPLSATVKQQHLSSMKDGSGADMKMDDALVKVEDQQQREHEREIKREHARERSGERERERERDRDRMAMRVEEPAARKMDVDENYDDESDEAGKASAGPGSQKGSQKGTSVNSGSGKATPGGGGSASGSQNGGFNDAGAAARTKVDVRTWRN